MSFDYIRDYLRLLIRQHVQINPTMIDPDRIRSVEHSRLAGLQAVDAIALGIHFGVKVNRYGETEPSYLSHLVKMLYRHKGVYLGYGVKLWPGDHESIKSEAPEVGNLEGL